MINNLNINELHSIINHKLQKLQSAYMDGSILKTIINDIGNISEKTFTELEFYDKEINDLTEVDMERLYKKMVSNFSNLVTKKHTLNNQELLSVYNTIKLVFDKVKFNTPLIRQIVKIFDKNKVTTENFNKFDITLFELFCDAPHVINNYWHRRSIEHIKKVINLKNKQINNNTDDIDIEDFDNLDPLDDHNDNDNDHNDNDNDNNNISIKEKTYQLDKISSYETFDKIMSELKVLNQQGCVPTHKSFYQMVKFNTSISEHDKIELVKKFFEIGYIPLKNIIQTFMNFDTEVLSIYKHPDLFKVIKNFIITKKVFPFTDLIELYNENIFKEMSHITPNELLDIIKMDTTWGPKTLTELLNKLTIYITNNENLTMVININDKNIDDIFKLSCEKKYKQIIDFFMNLGFQPNNDHMVCACIRSLHASALALLYNAKLFVNRECFYKYIDTYIQYYQDNEIDYDLETMISFGLQFDLECLEYTLEHNLIVKDLEKFGIQYDDNLYELCCKLNKFPRPYMKKLNEIMGTNTIMLRNIFKSSSCKTIDRYIKLNNLVPDKYCFKNALKYNSEAIDIVIHFRYSPSTKEIMEVGDYYVRMKMFELFCQKCPYRLE